MYVVHVSIAPPRVPPSTAAAVHRTRSNKSIMTLNTLAARYMDRRRLEAGRGPCGIEAIVTACKKAFGVTRCRCLEHSDGGCRTPVATQEAGEGNPIPGGDEGQREAETDLDEVGGSEAYVSDVSSGTLTESSAEFATEVGPDGRTLQETGQSITTRLEIKLTTDVEVGGVPCVLFFSPS